MILMKVLMVLPVVALPVFWLLPIGSAIAVFLVCVLLSGSMFWLMRRTDKMPVATGAEALVGQEVKVVSRMRSLGPPVYRVRASGEFWRARTEDAVEVGNVVTIVAVEGTTLWVRATAPVGHG